MRNLITAITIGISVGITTAAITTIILKYTILQRSIAMVIP